MERSSASLLGLDNWDIIARFLPPDWDTQARQLGAIRRARYNSDPSVVLRILLMHLACGCSLAETAARASAAGLAQISAVGVFKRLRGCGAWLQWLAQQMRGEAEIPLGVAGRRVRAVDATWVSEPGSTGSDWQLLYAVNLGDLECDFFELSAARQGGESFNRVPVRAGDIVLGDRVYAAPPSVAHAVEAGADVVVRLNRGALPLYDGQGARIDVLAHMKDLSASDPGQWSAAVKRRGGPWLSGRLIGLRQSEAATQRAQRQLRRRAQRDGCKVTAESLESAAYFMLWTSLPPEIAAEQVLELYRLRWQVELVFKRMKSILGLGHLPKKDPRSAQAWLVGKLFVGLLVERMIATARTVSPWGYELPAPAEPLARV